MFMQRSKVTSSGVFGPPEGGVSQSIVPALLTSSSYDGQIARCNTDRADAPATESDHKGSLQPLRLRGGGEENEGRREDGDQAGPPVPVVHQQTRPGPRCSKEKKGEGEGKGKTRKDKDWNRNRRITSSDEDETEGGTKEEEEEWTPPQPLGEILNFAEEAREGARRKLRSAEEVIILSKPRIVAVTTLEGQSRVRLPSPGLKRGREEEEEVGMEVEVEEELEGSYLSSREPSTSRDRGSQEQRPKRRKPGRPAVNPENEGKFTAVKIRQRMKEKELERVEEKEGEISDPSVKATSVRAEAVERNAVRIMDGLREVPTPELAEKSLQAIEVIKKVASTSKNMKGAFVGALWRSSEELTALSLTYTRRLREMEVGRMEDGEKGGEMEKLRSDLSSIRTEHALMRSVNQRLREQIVELRARVVCPEKSPPPTPLSRTRRKGERRGKQIDSDSSSTEEMEAAMERELSPEARWIGIQARREVKKDMEGGTLPPALRPSIKGRPRDLDGGLGERGASAHLLQEPERTPQDSRGGVTGITQEEIVRLIQSTVSRLIPQLGAGAAQPDKKKEERAQSSTTGPKGKISSTVPVAEPVKGTAGERRGGKKKRKRKGKKGKGGSASQQGGDAPKGTAPPLQPKKESQNNRDPLPFPETKEMTPPPGPDGNVRGGDKEATWFRGNLGPGDQEREREQERGAKGVG